MRRTALLGLAFVVTDLVALVLGGRLPAVDEPARSLADFYADNSGRLLAQAYVRGLAMGLLVLFAARLRARSFATPLLVVAAIELVRVAVVAGLVLTVDRSAAGAVPALHAIGLILGGVIAFPIAAGTVALTPTLRTGFPAWLAPAGVVLAAAWLATAFRNVSENQALWTAGTIVTALWGVWLVALCLSLRSREEQTLATI